MNTSSFFSPGFAAIAAAIVAAAGGGHALANEAAHWNRVACDVTARALPLDPLTESRILAIAHLAMHDAANAVSPRFAPYGNMRADAAGASVDAAIAGAAATALRALLPGHGAVFDAEFETRTSQVSDVAARDRGVAVGRRIALDLLERRKADGAANAVAWPAGQRPGEYRPTPPDFTPAFASHWGKVQPFALRTSDQFRPAPPPALNSVQALADLAEVRALGGADSAQRTFEQSEIACFWYEASTQGWNRIARELGLARKLDVWDHARLLALANVALADGFIAGFEAKYHFNYWRPATAIRENGHPEWLSFLPTPPVPDYPSTHTVLGAAAAAAIERCLGTDTVAFAMTSGEPYPNITRRFWSLSQAAQENGASRVFAGLHFTTAVRAGYRQGTEVGAWAAETLLRPLPKADVASLTATQR